GFEITDFGKRQFQEPFVALASHGNVAPRRAAPRFFPAARGDDFLAQHSTTPQIGPQPTAPLIRQRLAIRVEQPEANAVADETQTAAPQNSSFMFLEKADGTAKYANHAEPEWIGIDDRLTQRENAFVHSILFFFRIWRISPFGTGVFRMNEMKILLALALTWVV